MLLHNIGVYFLIHTITAIKILVPMRHGLVRKYEMVIDYLRSSSNIFLQMAMSIRKSGQPCSPYRAYNLKPLKKVEILPQ
jgi:hypothetical protein